MANYEKKRHKRSDTVKWVVAVVAIALVVVAVVGILNIIPAESTEKTPVVETPVDEENLSMTEVAATISFDDVANRTEFSTEKQVWEQNGVTVTNEKGESTSNVGDYYNPARFYKNSTLTIAYPGMAKLVLDCTGTGSANLANWQAVTELDGATISVDGSTITIVLAAKSDSFTFQLSAALLRVVSIDIYTEVGGESEDLASGDTIGKEFCAIGAIGKISNTTYGDWVY